MRRHHVRSNLPKGIAYVTDTKLATVLWRPPWDLGERWRHAMSTKIPLLSLDVSANVQASFSNGLRASAARLSSASGLGDIVLMPLMLNY
jgi:hypothetical protein